ncbi:hypothetical protein KM043_018547, partial [Ampulex compressa]
MKGPGYMAVTAGEVIHIVKCIPVEVKVRHTEQCYDELPVMVKNISSFVTPKTRILTSHGSMRDCSNVLPVMYKIEDSWHRFIP